MPSIFNNTLDKLIFIVPQDNTLGYQTGGVLGDGVELLLDATTEVEVTYGADVTTYFVNAGTDNTDHIKNLPRTVRFTGIISNDLGLGGFLRSLVGSAESNPATLYHADINQAMFKKTLFSAHIPNIGVLNNCAITRCSFKSDANTYNAFKVSMELKEIRLPEDVTEIPAETVVDVVPTEQTITSQSTETVNAPIAAGNPINPNAVAGGAAEASTSSFNSFASAFSALSFPPSGVSTVSDGIGVEALLGGG